MSYRVVQWATGNVGRAAIEGVLDHPDLELVGCWVHSADKDGADVGDARRPRPDRRSPPPATSTRSSRSTPTASSTARSSPTSTIGDPDPRVGQERRDAARLVLSARPRSAPGSTTMCRARRRDAARHRHPPRRHHRAVPADGVGAVGLDHPRAGRGVLRHPHLRRARRHPRLDAVRHHARGGAHEHHGRGARRRVRAVGAHGGRRARLRARARAADDARDGGRHRADRLAHRARSRPAWSRRNASAGRDSSTANRW